MLVLHSQDNYNPEFSIDYHLYNYEQSKHRFLFFQKGYIQTYSQPYSKGSTLGIDFGEERGHVKTCLLTRLTTRWWAHVAPREQSVAIKCPSPTLTTYNLIHSTWTKARKKRSNQSQADKAREGEEEKKIKKKNLSESHTQAAICTHRDRRHCIANNSHIYTTTLSTLILLLALIPSLALLSNLNPKS